MSAAALTKQLLTIKFLEDEQNFLNCLTDVLKEFVSTRSPIFPRQDVIVCLLKAMTVSTNISLIKLVIATLTEFCTKSNTYDANYVRRHLTSLKIVKVLCSVLSGNRLYSDQKLSEACLSLLRRLSDVLLPAELQITLSDIVPLCISLCNMKKQALFTYSSTFRLKAKELMLHKNLSIEIHEYDDGASSKKCALMEQLFGCKQLQLTHCTGEVFSTSPAENANVKEVLVEQGLVWYCPEASEGEEPSECTADSSVCNSQDSLRDVIPTQMAYGPHFFAHQQEKLGQIADIEQILQDSEHQPYTSAPQSGDMVTIRGSIVSPHCKVDAKEVYYRAQVCQKMESKDSYMVIALDYGLVKEIHPSQIYHPCLTLIHIMPSTTLFTLRGIYPSPFSLDMLDSALSILQTLTVGNFTISENLVNQWSAFNVLSALALTAPHHTICTKAMIVFTHLSHCSRVRTNGVVRDKAVTKTLRLINRFTKLSWRDTTIAACKALSAMLFENPSASPQLEPGMATLLNILSSNEDDTEIRTAVLQVLRNYLGPVDLSLQGRAVNSLEAVTTSSSETSENPGAAKPILVTPTQLPTPSPSSSNMKSAVEDGKPQSKDNHAKKTRISRAGSRHRRIDLEQISEQEFESPINSANPAPVDLNMSADSLSLKDFYPIGEQTTLKMSDSCSVFESDSSMDCISVQKLLVGFLNAGLAGHLIYGVDANGKVLGVHIDRDRRDQLRLGLDRICCDLEPPLTYHMPTLHFIPVCFAENAEDETTCSFMPDRYIVAIAISANMNEVGYRLKSDSRIFVRSGTHTITGSTQDLRELITAKMEAHLC